jgi:PilZ domain
MSERRSEIRNPCYLRADIIVSHDAEPVMAEAHDISDHGLRLVVLNARRIPNEFIVSIPRRHIRETVRVVRREEGELGVLIKRPATA